MAVMTNIALIYNTLVSCSHPRYVHVQFLVQARVWKSLNVISLLMNSQSISSGYMFATLRTCEATGYDVFGLYVDL